MNFSTLKRELKFWDACAQARVPLWECPSVLFIGGGAITIIGMLATYYIATLRGVGPELIITSVSVIGSIIFTLGVVIAGSFDRVVKAGIMRSEFLSIASHQLRAPLASMKWVFNVLLDEHIGTLNDKQRDYLHRIQTDNERMIILINNLLDVSRIEAGGVTLVKQRIDLEALIWEAAKNVSQRFGMSAQDIVFDFSSLHTAVFADERYVRAIFENLLDNALRYGRGKKNVVVRVHTSKHNARIEVEDFGVGIRKDDQQFVFQKFFRSSATDVRAEGKGISLFISKYLAEEMGGRIGFYSQEREGSLFWVELPLFRN